MARLRALLRTPRGRWTILAVLWAAVIVLGIGGFVQQARDNDLDRTPLDTLYLTLQLATLSYDETTGLNWRLEVARFLAPLVAASTLLQTATVVFREQFDRFRLRFMRDHTIVAGLGETGTRLALALADAGERVVAIDPDAAAVGVGTVTQHEVTVLVGDARERDVLQTARADRARRLVVACGSDATNVGITATARTIERDGPTALRVVVQLADTELCDLLRGGDLDSRDTTRLSFFNLHEAAARAWVSTHPPSVGAAPPRPVVVGLGQLGRSLVVALAQRWAEQGDGSPLRVTLVDRVATGRWGALRLQHPALAEVCTPTLLDIDLDEPTEASLDLLRASLETGGPTWVAVAFEDEAAALSAALLVRQSVRDADVPIVVRSRTDAGLGALLADRLDGSAWSGLSVFPMLDQTCTVAMIDGGVREQLARGVHEDYLVSAGSGDGLRRPWDELDDAERDLSRRRVDGILADLDDIGCDLVPLRRWGAPAVALTESEVDRLAAREHQRWFDDRTAVGWTHGPVRDDAQRHNPLLVAWAELDDDAQRFNLDMARALPGLLARAGLEPQRRS